MKHCGTVTLETERLRLRRLTAMDAPTAFRNWMSDPAVVTYLRWQAYTEIADAEAMIDRWIKAYAQPHFYQWAIEFKEIGEPIGTISAVDMDERAKKVHLGYCIGSRWWHCGIMSEALAAVMHFFFTEVGVNRIESQHDPKNPYSGAVMKKCGMIYEGTLRQADWNNRGIVDACMYALLREEYPAGRA